MKAPARLTSGVTTFRGALSQNIANNVSRKTGGKGPSYPKGTTTKASKR